MWITWLKPRSHRARRRVSTRASTRWTRVDTRLRVCFDARNQTNVKDSKHSHRPLRRASRRVDARWRASSRPNMQWLKWPNVVALTRNNIHNSLSKTDSASQGFSVGVSDKVEIHRVIMSRKGWRWLEMEDKKTKLRIQKEHTNSKKMCDRNGHNDMESS